MKQTVKSILNRLNNFYGKYYFFLTFPPLE